MLSLKSGICNQEKNTKKKTKDCWAPGILPQIRTAGLLSSQMFVDCCKKKRGCFEIVHFFSLNMWYVWCKNGTLSMQDLYTRNKFASFEQLAKRFSIPKSNFFRYLQLRNFVSSHTDCFPSRPPVTLFICPPPFSLSLFFSSSLAGGRVGFQFIRSMLYCLYV